MFGVMRLVLLPLLLLVFLPRCVQSRLSVQVQPESPLLFLGSRSHLVCGVDGCSGPASFRWVPLDDRPLAATVASNTTHSTVTFDPVQREHEGALLCQGICGSERGQSLSQVQVYALPSSPLVSGSLSVLVGSQSSLVCEVRDMYPTELLHLVWTRGDQVLVRAQADSGSTLVRATLDFTPPPRPGSELGPGPEPGTGPEPEPGPELTLDFTCKAWMDLDQLSPDQRSRETKVRVQLLSPPTRVSLLVTPEQLLEGRGFTITCQSDGTPPPALVLSRNGAELQQKDAANFLVFSQSAAQLQDSAHYQCESTNQYGAARDGRNITVRDHPLQVSVHQQVTAADAGSSLVLSCETQGCSQSPVLTWTKTIKTRDQLGPVLLQTSDQTGSRLVLQDLKLEDSGIYSCEAQCDSVTRRGLTQVQVYSLPSDPVLSPSGPLVLGRSLLFCTIHSVFPKSRLQLQWLMGNQTLVTSSGFPLSESQNLTLELDQDLLLRQDLENPLRLSCRAQMLTEEGEVWRSRSTSTTITIENPPRSVSLSVTPEQLLEGRGFTITCQSDGTPPPALVLSRNGAELLQKDAAHFLVFSTSAAQLQDSAHYQCESTNQHGVARDGRNITVRAPPRITSVLVLPSGVVFEGQNVTVCCSSVCAPPPSVSLSKLTNGTQRHSVDGTFLLVNVSSQDSGLYQLNVSNELGFEVQVFTLSVRGRSSPPSPLLVLVSSLCILIVFTVVALLLECVRRARKKGFYHLSTSPSCT